MISPWSHVDRTKPLTAEVVSTDLSDDAGDDNDITTMLRSRAFPESDRP